MNKKWTEKELERDKFRRLVGWVVERARINKGLSKKELGEKIGYAQNSASQAISKIESGKIGIPNKKISRLIQVLEITHESLAIEDKRFTVEAILGSADVFELVVKEQAASSNPCTTPLGAPALTASAVMGGTAATIMHARAGITGAALAGTCGAAGLTGGAATASGMAAVGSVVGGAMGAGAVIAAAAPIAAIGAAAYRIVSLFEKKEGVPKELPEKEQGYDMEIIRQLCRGDEEKIKKIVEILNE